MYLRVVIVDIRQLMTLRGQLPLVDVRSEGEYRDGHIPAAINIPILNNEERVVVGTTYKKLGQQQAIKEGFRLVGPRLIDIVTNAENVGKELIVHCWRGGMRSGNFCQFVNMAGIKTHQVKGGYKAYRQFGAEYFEKQYPFLVLSGLTGSGKTEILRALKNAGEQVIDLEDLANHKGSVFGGLGQRPQPSTEHFQNLLFEELFRVDTSRRIWIEDESIAVGKIFLPAPFWKGMSLSAIISVDVPREIRTARLVDEYGHVDRHGFANALKGITKKLGGQHYNTAVEHLNAGNMYDAIGVILNYYDKAYATGLERKKDRIKNVVPWDGASVATVVKQLVEVADQKESALAGR
jgi:tRNA 2-selenouridine synthase